uniref:Uncharacterized protein n=1 Tax=Oryza punctata TaxID=4537 RepID=A0A0E0M103_ORYPU
MDKDEMRMDKVGSARLAGGIGVARFTITRYISRRGRRCGAAGAPRSRANDFSFCRRRIMAMAFGRRRRDGHLLLQFLLQRHARVPLLLSSPSSTGCSSTFGLKAQLKVRGHRVKEGDAAAIQAPRQLQQQQCFTPPYSSSSGFTLPAMEHPRREEEKELQAARVNRRNPGRKEEKEEQGFQEEVVTGAVALWVEPSPQLALERRRGFSPMADRAGAGQLRGWSATAAPPRARTAGARRRLTGGSWKPSSCLYSNPSDYTSSI